MFNKLKQALVKTSSAISTKIENIFLKKKLDEHTLNSLEELLIESDIGSGVAMELVQNLKNIKFTDQVTTVEIKNNLSNLVTKLLSYSNHQFELNKKGLNIVLICGVNGSGKTTSIGKLAAIYAKAGKKVAIAACDTFRAAAVEQLASWAHLSCALFFTGDKQADPASVAYKAISQSLDNNVDVLFIDTAGRLHNQKNLMDELGKIIRVIKKIDSTAPHHSLMVLDGTVGQNAYAQITNFIDVANVTGLIVTKLDGSTKAGVIVGVGQKFHLPIYFIGIGEQVEDLKSFDPHEFAKALIG